MTSFLCAGTWRCWRRTFRIALSSPMTSAMNAKIMVSRISCHCCRDTVHLWILNYTISEEEKSKQHVLAFFIPNHIEVMPLLAQPGAPIVLMPKKHVPHLLYEIFTHPTPHCHSTWFKSLQHYQCNSGQFRAIKHSALTLGTLWSHSGHTQTAHRDHSEITQR